MRAIIMSGNIHQDLAGYGIGQANLPLLHKPFEPQALVALVEQTLRAPLPSMESLTANPSKAAAVGDGWVD